MLLFEIASKPITGFNGRKYPVYINPTKEELLSIYEQSSTIRIIIDYKNKNIFCFSGDILHEDAAEELLGIGYSAKQSNYLFLKGDSLTKDFKISDIYSSLFDLVLDENFEDINEVYPYIEKLINKNWSWIYDYIDSSSFEHEKRYWIRRFEKAIKYVLTEIATKPII